MQGTAIDLDFMNFIDRQVGESLLDFVKRRSLFFSSIKKQAAKEKIRLKDSRYRKRNISQVRKKKKEYYIKKRKNDSSSSDDDMLKKRMCTSRPDLDNMNLDYDFTHRLGNGTQMDSRAICNDDSVGGVQRSDTGSGLSAEDTDMNNFLRSLLSESDLRKLLERVEKRCSRGNTYLNSDGKEDPDYQRAHVCVVCDRIIIGMEEVKYISKEQLIENADRLSVSSYEEHFCISLKRELVCQYEVEDDDLRGILLSPRSQCRDGVNYQCCVSCYNSCTRGKKDDELSSPPKFAIANGFAIGHIPNIISFPDKQGDVIRREINHEKDLTDVICGSISPVRPFGRVFAFHGGKQKSVKGQFSLFSVDQSHVGGVINKYRNIDNAHKNIFVVLCGRMTPGQKQLVRREAEMDTDVFLSLLNWFIKSSGHPAYQEVTPPDDCPDPVVILQDEDTQNNTDEPVDPSVECKIEGKTYYFSSEAHQPNEGNSIYDSNQQFLEAMLQSHAPTMLMYGGSYLKAHEINLEDAFPIQFPFGTGGPSPGIDRKVAVSIEACLGHYMRLSLNQFMRPDFILVCYHIWCRNASYKTGLIKCKSDFQGKALGEKISQLSVDDIKEASNELCEMQASNEPLIGTSTATQFLKRITTSCKALGHTTEAAKDARRKVYALSERFGSHSLFFTVTPDDECTFRVRMYANMGDAIKLPRADCTDAECFADFTLRQQKRLRYPGACSIFYQSIIQAVYELLGWDLKKNRKRGIGIFGEPEAICHADEEQGRTTLHAHFLVWLKHFDKVRELLFHSDEDIQERARDIMRQYVDDHFCSDYNYDETLPVIHEECQQCLPLNEIFKETDNLQDIRDGRNKNLAPVVCGKVLSCTSCGLGVSTVDTFESVMRSYKGISDSSGMSVTTEDVTIPPSRYRQDIMTYRCPVDHLHVSDEFFYNKKVRSHVATFRMNEHDWKHRKPCFKHGMECRFSFPMQCHDCGFIEDDTDPTKETTWEYVDARKQSMDIFPYTVLSMRKNGSQYLNTHSRIITEQFGCNSNIQMGSPRCVFYVVHYATKSTQKEDRGADYDKIGRQVIRRIAKEKARVDEELRQHKINEGDGDESSVDNNESEEQELDPNTCFREGLCRFLIGMSVHLSQDVISATMAHLLMCNNGSRFTFTHEFKDLMVGQMLNWLHGESPGDFVLRRRNKGSEGELYMWPDYSINDYLFRPTELEGICFYEFGMKYEKVPFSFDRMKKLNNQGLPLLKDGEMYFAEEHPGRRYCYLKENSCEQVPKLSTPNDVICDIAKLELGNAAPSEAVKKRRHQYAEVALVLFFPFRNNSVIHYTMNDGSLWNKYQKLLQQPQNPNLQHSSFWPYGGRILQNMQDMIQSRKCKVAADPLQSDTVLNTEGISNANEGCDDYANDSDCSSVFDDALSVGAYLEGECCDYDDFENERDTQIRRNLDDFKKCKRLVPSSIINSRMYDNLSLLKPSEPSDAANSDDNGETSLNVSDSSQHDQHVPFNPSKYKTLLGFVAGASLNISHENDDSDSINQDLPDHYKNNVRIDDAFLNEIDWEDLGFASGFNKSVIPTMSQIAIKVAEDSNVTLDRVQYAAYEIICSSFMLNMVNEGWYDKASEFGVRDEEVQEQSVQSVMKRVKQNLIDLGAEKQLLMFVTGPAGAGKSTAITVAQQFCYEFCISLGIKWNENTFMFTATTGCAAALFDGTTLHSVSFLNSKKKNITDAMMKPWKNVKLLIVDEISMSTDDMMNKLSDYLNHFRRCVDPTSHFISDKMIFGGYSIIYSGDFRQIPPVGANDEQLLYKARGLWENSLNVAVIFQDSHRFKEDQMYGDIMMRMWKGLATKDDIDIINGRLLGSSLSIPVTEPDDDIAYACAINSERGSIHASVFQRHIQNFPTVEDDELPPNHTIILEADILEAPKRRPGKRKNGNNDNDINIPHLKIDSVVRNRIYSSLSDFQLKEKQKLVDPALKLYVGACCMINDNEDVSKGRANGTLCRVVSLKMKENDTQLQWRNYDGKKVFYANASDIDHVEFEHFPKTKRQIKLQSELDEMRVDMERNNYPAAEYKKKITELEIENKKRRFKLRPKTFYCTFNIEDIRKNSKVPLRMKTSFKVTVKQLPVILNDATTGHKLQGMSKNQVIVQSWSYRNPGWIYTVLSRVRTLKGLFLCERLSFQKYQKSCMKNANDLKAFDERIKEKIPLKAR